MMCWIDKVFFPSFLRLLCKHDYCNQGYYNSGCKIVGGANTRQSIERVLAGICLALHSSCLYGDPLPQPHAKETVIDDVAAVVLVNQLLVNQRRESGFDAAQCGQAVFLLELIGHRGLHLSLAGDGQQQCTLIVGQGRVIVLKSGLILVNQLLNGMVNLGLADDIDSMISIDTVHDGLQVPRLPIQLLVHIVEHRC